MKLHRVLLTFLYLLTASATVFLIIWGGDFYLTPFGDRPHHELYDQLKPSGFVSHGLGILGSFLVVLLLLYIARKHLRFMQGWGNIRNWLNYHIWLGITGPILITFHTTFKFGGIVAISFWSMIAVALSGFFGRYIYLQIPRRINGQEISVNELHQMEEKLVDEVGSRFGEKSQVLELLQKSGDASKTKKKGLLSVFSWITQDLQLRIQLRKFKHELAAEGLSTEEIKEITNLVAQQQLLKRRINFLSTARAILHYWHVIHRPFALVMFVILVVHVAVEILLGYTWIF
ncbi:hypothetical protein K8I28_06945 [bacterium]|nr:hypothetical protein [bacterium]